MGGLVITPPQPLGADHIVDEFSCGKPVLDEWLIRYARQSQSSGSAKTFVVLSANRVVGYYSLTVGQVESLDTPDRIRQGVGKYPIPDVLLARLAVEQSAQGQALGIGMLKDAIRRSLVIAEQAGVRALLTHPIDADAAGFYTHFGFIASPVREDQLLLLLKDAKRVVTKVGA